MSIWSLSRLDFEKVRLLHQTKSLQICEVRFEGQPAILSRFRNFRLTGWINHSLLLKSNLIGLDKHQHSCSLSLLPFVPSKIPEKLDVSILIIQLIALYVALDRRGMCYRWPPESLLFDGQHFYLAGFVPVRAESKFERRQLSIEFLKSLRTFAANRGTENEAVIRILQKFERHSKHPLRRCLRDVLKLHPSHNATLTSFEIEREKELDIVTGIHELSQRSKGSGILIYGEPGEGKSTFLGQVESSLMKKQTMLLKFHSPEATQSNGAARKWIDSIFESLGIYKNCKAEFAAGGWKNFLDGSAAPDLSNIVHTFFKVLAKVRKPGETQIFLIDDVDRFDADSLRILSSILHGVADHPVLFVMTATQKLELATNLIAIEFQRLPFQSFVKALTIPFWKPEQKRSVLKKLYDNSAGNPFLFSEFLQQLLLEKQDSITWQDHHWSLPDQSVIAFPKSVLALYVKFMKHLSDSELLLLKTASIQGGSFDPSFITIDGRAHLLTSLEEKGILIRRIGQYEFRYSLFADFLYQQVEPGTKSQLHEQLANHISRTQGPASTIGKHLARAGKPQEAMKLISKSDDLLDLLNELENFADQLSNSEVAMILAEKAALLFRKGRYPLAAEAYGKLQKIGSPEILIRYAQSLFFNHEILPAQSILQQAEKLLPQVENTRLEIAFYFTRALCSWYRGERRMEDFDKGLQLAERCQDYDALATGYRHRAEFALREGSLKDAKEFAFKALKYANKVSNDEQTGCAWRVLGSLAWRASKHKHAVRILKRSIRSFEKIDHQFGIAVAWSLIGNVHVEQYRFREAMYAFQKAASMFHQLGHPHEVSLAHFNRGLIHIEQGRLTEAERIFLRCRFMDKKAGNKRYFAYDLRALAVVSMLRGFHRKADRLLKRTLEICEELHAEGDVLQTNLILLFSQLEQKQFLKAEHLIEFFKKRMDRLQEPMIRSEVHYLFAHYYGYLNESEKALRHLKQSLQISKEIRYHKLTGMNLILKLIFRRKVPERNDADFHLATRMFRKCGNEIALSDYLLMLFQAYPSLLKQKQYALWLPKMQRIYRKIKHGEKHRQVRQLTQILSMEKDSSDELFECWNDLLLMFHTSRDLETNMQKVLGRLTSDLKASASLVRLKQASGATQIISCPENRNGATNALREKIWSKILNIRRSLCLHRSDLQELPAPEDADPQITSVLAVPILNTNEALGMWYFERWEPQPAFSRNELNKITFFSTAASPLLENAIHLEQEKQPETIATYSFSNFVGRSKEMQEVYRQMTKLAKLDISVLILGESGTGKELVAKALHQHSARSGSSFLAVNCSAIPETLIESELFGFNRGAFTGATISKPGLIEQAHKGTLFLDEIGDLTPATQAKLLRVMQEREIQRLGDTTARKIDVRFLFATHKDLNKLVHEQLYREDLYYRISVYTLHLPPLRERKEDIAQLANFFLKKFEPLFEKENMTFSSAALRVLSEYSWPGNVRELENVVQSLLVNVESNVSIEPSDLPSQITGARNLQKFSGLSLEEAKQEFEKEFLMQSLLRNRWNKTHTARDLKITRQGLINMIQRLGLQK